MTHRPSRPRSTTATIAAATVSIATLIAGGCAQTPGGPQASRDRFTYESTAHMPQTVVLTDIRTGEELWTSEIPVGKKLTLQFYPDRSTNEYFPDLMRWEMMDRSTWRRGLRNAMRVPPSHARRLDVSMREAPEFETDFNSGRADAGNP